MVQISFRCDTYLRRYKLLISVTVGSGRAVSLICDFLSICRERPSRALRARSVTSKTPAMAITERTLFIRTVKVKNTFKFYVLHTNGSRKQWV